jgi:pectate lyase
MVVLVASPASAADRVGQYLKKPEAWYAGDEARQIAANVLSHQSDLGGWPKNTDTTKPFAGDRKGIKPTFDNGATTDELRFLPRVFDATADAKLRTAFEKGLDHILKAQYPTGGWPQSYPPPERTYHRHITFNDDAMVRLMEFLREVATQPRYAFVDANRRAAAKAAFDRGVACVLKCQVVVDGKPTVWCAQHDEIDFRPRPGRTYELVSLSGAESVGIVRLLMSLEEPSPEVVRAVEGAVAWFRSAKLTGIRVETRPDPTAPKGRNKVVMNDPTAPPLWARFYEIGSNRPLFADRDGVAKYALSEIGSERRNGYAWYGIWPAHLLDVEYPAWKTRVGK